MLSWRSLSLSLSSQSLLSTPPALRNKYNIHPVLFKLLLAPNTFLKFSFYCWFSKRARDALNRLKSPRKSANILSLSATKFQYYYQNRAGAAWERCQIKVGVNFRWSRGRFKISHCVGPYRAIASFFNLHIFKISVVSLFSAAASLYSLFTLFFSLIGFTRILWFEVFFSSWDQRSSRIVINYFFYRLGRSLWLKNFSIVLTYLLSEQALTREELDRRL